MWFPTKGESFPFDYVATDSISMLQGLPQIQAHMGNTNGTKWTMR